MDCGTWSMVYDDMPCNSSQNIMGAITASLKPYLYLIDNISQASMVHGRMMHGTWSSDHGPWPWLTETCLGSMDRGPWTTEREMFQETVAGDKLEHRRCNHSIIETNFFATQHVTGAHGSWPHGHGPWTMVHVHDSLELVVFGYTKKMRFLYQIYNIA